METQLLKDFSGKKVLILGGIGFIGSNLAIQLASMGAAITIVDSMLNQYGGNLENVTTVRNQVRINFSDIRDTHTLDYIIQGVEIIYSLAGQTSHIESMDDPQTDLDINCRSQLSILESCRRNNPDVAIIYASTRQVYGRPQYLPVNENHPIKPVDVNGINKYAAEMYYMLYSSLYNMRCVCLRLTNTYGPRQQLRGDKQGFSGIFIRKAILGEEISIFGNGQQKRDFNFVDDVVDAILLASYNLDTCCGNVYNLGAQEIYSLLDFINILSQYCEFKFKIVPFPDEHKAIDIGDYYSDYTLFNSATNWAPKIMLDEGLKRTIEYFKPRIEKYL